MDFPPGAFDLNRNNEYQFGDIIRVTRQSGIPAEDDRRWMVVGYDSMRWRWITIYVGPSKYGLSENRQSWSDMAGFELVERTVQ